MKLSSNIIISTLVLFLAINTAYANIPSNWQESTNFRGRLLYQHQFNLGKTVKYRPWTNDYRVLRGSTRKNFSTLAQALEYLYISFNNEAELNYPAGAPDAYFPRSWSTQNYSWERLSNDNGQYYETVFNNQVILNYFPKGSSGHYLITTPSHTSRANTIEAALRFAKITLPAGTSYPEFPTSYDSSWLIEDYAWVVASSSQGTHFEARFSNNTLIIFYPDGAGGRYLVGTDTSGTRATTIDQALEIARIALPEGSSHPELPPIPEPGETDTPPALAANPAPLDIINWNLTQTPRGNPKKTTRFNDTSDIKHVPHKKGAFFPRSNSSSGYGQGYKFLEKALAELNRSISGGLIYPRKYSNGRYYNSITRNDFFHLTRPLAIKSSQWYSLTDLNQRHIEILKLASSRIIAYYPDANVYIAISELSMSFSNQLNRALSQLGYQRNALLCPPTSQLALATAHSRCSELLPDVSAQTITAAVRNARAIPDDSDASRWGRLLQRYSSYIIDHWWPAREATAIDEDQRIDYYLRRYCSSSTSAVCARELSQFAYTLAIARLTNNYYPSPNSSVQTNQQLESYIKRIILGLTDLHYRHHDSPLWLNDNFSLLRSAHYSIASAVIWPSLTQQQQQKILRTIELDAMSASKSEPPASSRNIRSDSAAEEFGWMSQGLDAAGLMLNNHPAANFWKNMATEYKLNAVATESDMNRRLIIDGQPLNQWLFSFSLTEEYAYGNHGAYPYPTYNAGSGRQALMAVPHFSLFGELAPEAALFNQKQRFNMLKNQRFGSNRLPMYAANGTISWPISLGSIRSNRDGFRQNNYWVFASFDALMDQIFDDPTNTIQADRWEKKHLTRLESITSTATGKVSPRPGTSIRQHQASRDAAVVYLTYWLKANQLLRVPQLIE